MARPRKEIDQAQFEKLCGIQCTQEEICGFFDVTDKTLNAWCRRTYRKSFSEVFKIKRQAGRISLRRSQFQLAQKNAAMAIFLGKNFLGQTDTAVVEHHADNNLFEMINNMNEDGLDDLPEVQQETEADSDVVEDGETPE